MSASAPPPAPVEHDAYDALVLGAGISGLVSASVLLEQGARRIAVVDSYERAGGNISETSRRLNVSRNTIYRALGKR